MLTAVAAATGVQYYFQLAGGVERAGRGGVGGRLARICVRMGVGGLGGALLGPEKSGGPVGWQGDAGFLWLFGCWIVDASIFVAVCSDRFPGHA